MRSRRVGNSGSVSSRLKPDLMRGGIVSGVSMCHMFLYSIREVL